MSPGWRLRELEVVDCRGLPAHQRRVSFLDLGHLPRLAQVLCVLFKLLERGRIFRVAVRLGDFLDVDFHLDDRSRELRLVNPDPALSRPVNPLPVSDHLESVLESIELFARGVQALVFLGVSDLRRSRWSRAF